MATLEVLSTVTIQVIGIGKTAPGMNLTCMMMHWLLVLQVLLLFEKCLIHNINDYCFWINNADFSYLLNYLNLLAKNLIK